MLKIFLKPMLLIFSFIVGFVFYRIGEAAFLLPYLIQTMLLLIFLRLDFKELRFRRQHFVVWGANILIALLFFGIFFWGAEKKFALAAFITAITPSATASPVIIAFLGGNVNFAATGLLMNNLLAAFVFPLLWPLVSGSEFSMQMFLTVFEYTAFLILLPFALALLIRLFYRPDAGFNRVSGNISFSAWLLTIILVAGKTALYLQQNPDISKLITLEMGLLSLVICAANFSVGYLLERGILRRECSQLLGQKNTGLAVCLALEYASPIVALAPTFYVLWQNLWNAFQLAQRARNEKATAAYEEPKSKAI